MNIILCIVLSIVIYLIYLFIGSNLIGFIIRSLYSKPEKDLISDSDEYVKRMWNKYKLINLRIFVLSFFITVIIFTSLIYFVNWEISIALALIMLSRIQDLLFEIRTEKSFNLKEYPNGFLSNISNVLGWASLPIIYYAICIKMDIF